MWEFFTSVFSVLDTMTSRFRYWLANRLLDVGLIGAAKWLVPELKSYGRRNDK